MKLTVLASSSSGNCSVISSQRSHVLVDAGLPARTTFEKLILAGIDPEHVTGIVITHEHGDHVAGLGALAKKLNIPVYLTAGTAAALSWKPGYTPILETIQPGAPFRVGDVDVLGFAIPHDANEPVGFLFKANGSRVAIVTDFGSETPIILDALAGADAILLESNHDVGMLKVGPYPWSVKERILSLSGHISNDVACSILRKLDRRTSTVILGHLSKQNNHPEIARLMAEDALGERLAATALFVAGTDVIKPVEL